MRRRGTWVTCDICLQGSVFVKNLEYHEKSGWKYLRKTKTDICPRCVKAKERYEKQYNTDLTWHEVRELFCRNRGTVREMLS